MNRNSLLAVTLVMTACVGKCSGDKKSEATPGASGTSMVEGESLILAARDQGAFLPPELASSEYADESTLPMSPYKLPTADFSTATDEVEPNNTAAVATAIGSGYTIRGQTGTGDVDSYSVETTGSPQLWAIEAVGRTVRGMNFNSAGGERAVSQQLDSGTQVIPNLFLAAGKHSIEVQPVTGPSGPYTLRMVPLGKADLRMEREPNDEDSFAQPLRAGISRIGFLLDRVDRDSYTFAVREATQVSLEVVSPPDLTLQLNLYRTNGSPTRTQNAAAKGENVRLETTVPAGEYIVKVKSNDKGSRTPYKLRLDLPDPFLSKIDREPNDDYGTAAPLTSELALRGSVGENNDADWYQLPTVTRETSMRVRVLGLSTGMNPRSSIHVISRSNGTNQPLNWAVADSAWGVRLPANAPLFIQMTGKGDYQLQLSFDPAIPAIAVAQAPFTISLPKGPALVEAFSTLAQRQPLPVSIDNPGTQPIQVKLEALVSHNAWSITPATQTVTVAAGKRTEVVLQVNISPDAGAGEAVRIAVRGTSPAGSASAMTTVYALCGATPANAETYSPLPSQLLGGLNLAAGGLGAHAVTSDVNNLGRETMLYDGMTPSDRAWTGDRTPTKPDILVTVALAGDTVSSIAGVSMLTAHGNPDEQIDQFDILTSEDGQTYQQAMSGRLRAMPEEQAFVFAKPVLARFAQLRVRSNQAGSSKNRSTLGEWKVIAAPGDHLKGETNLADPKAGGHIVWSQPLLSLPDALLNDQLHGPLLKLDPSSPNEWVVGFRYDRAAQISRLEWMQPPVVAGTRLLSSVDVSVSTEGPIGPWTSIGTWKIAPTAGTSSELKLPKPVWARFVRFSTTEATKITEYWKLAEPIKIFERETDSTYRSVLAEWGHYARPAIYETLVRAPPTTNAEEVTGNGKLSDAKKIESGKIYRGRVIVNEREGWYRIEVPRDHNRISLRMQGDPTVRAVASLRDEAGKDIPVETSFDPAGIMRVEAIVSGGGAFLLKLAEPPRSIALVWDNSSSIRNFSGTLYRALARFVETVQPGREFVNLLPFALKPKFLLASWSDQPYLLQGTVQNYNRGDASSNAETSLLAAAQELRNRTGSKAIVLVTDANTDGYPSTAEMWASFGRDPPRVFALELQLGNLADHQQRLMQDWAAANNGHYSTFRTSKDLDMAFDRASCYLRRPARYSLTVETRFEELPAPGGLEVVMAPQALADNAVEIILDASGSMLQMMGNRRKMDIARSTLVDLVEKTLPVGTPFAFRAFGTRLANCESDLLLNVQPLDRVKVGGMVRKLNATNLAKTPIGASLRAVAGDLKGVKGQKVVVLLTDGEETCDGDPAESIQYLKQQGLDIRMNIVGFDVGDSTLKATFERWATLGGGRYFDAKNGEQLSKALNEAMRPKFQVTDATGTVIAEGTAGGSRVTLPVGTYTVRVLTSPVRTFERIKITSKAQQRIEVK